MKNYVTYPPKIISRQNSTVQDILFSIDSTCSLVSELSSLAQMVDVSLSFHKSF
jgi:hypothetical protein